MAVIPPPDAAELRRLREAARYYDTSFVPGCRVPKGGRCGDVLVKLSSRDFDVGWVPWELLPLPCPTGLDGGWFDTIFDTGVDGGEPDTTFPPFNDFDGGGAAD